MRLLQDKVSKALFLKHDWIGGTGIDAMQLFVALNRFRRNRSRRATEQQG